MKTNIIIHGDAFQELKKLQEKSINMCMTSPPYWALRDYGDGNSQIWGGEKDCEHDFEIKERYVHRGSAKNTVHGAINAGGLEVDWKTKDGFCNKCGAWKGQLGLEPTFDLYINNLCDIFDEVKRVLRDDGTCWVNIGDSYAGQMGKKSGWTDNKAVKDSVKKGVTLTKKTKIIHQLPQKCLVMIPFRFAIEMVNRGWILRNTIIWHKPNCMPSSTKDRFTVDFEYIFFFSKKKKYYFDTQYEDAKTKSSASFNLRVRDVKRGYAKKSDQYKASKKEVEQYHGQQIKYGNKRRKRSMWSISPKPFKEAHFAVYPEELCEIPIKAGCPKDGIVLDPFWGAGTTGLVALKQGKKSIGIELNKDYIKIAKARLKPYLEQTTL